jgi:hypothetical protein
MKKSLHPTIHDLVEQFKLSTIAYFEACDEEKFKKQKAEVDRTNAIIEALDFFGGDGRLALIPLLDDADQGIRVGAAAYLLKVMPERAIAVLEEIRKGSTIFPRLTAGEVLDSYTTGRWGE